jgi:hypothetical protein
MAITQLAEFTHDMYTQAGRDQGSYINFSQWLDDQVSAGHISNGLIPTPEERREKAGKNMSSLQWLFAKAGIKVRGKQASKAGVFFKNDPNYVKGADVLFGAFVAAVYDDWMNKPNMASVDNTFFSNPGSDSDMVFPTIIADTFRDFALKDRRMLLKLVLTDLVSLTTGIDGDSYKAAYIDLAAEAELEPGRVNEGADIPFYEMKTGDQGIKIHKYGGAVRATYEVLRRQRINKVARTIIGIARREEIRKIKAALAVLVNGDGNANPAISVNSGAATWNLADFDDWAIDIAADYDEEITIVATDKAEAKAINALKQAAANQQLNPDQLSMYGTGELSLPTGQRMKLAPNGSVLQGSGSIVGWNPLNAVEQVVENGSIIREAERFVLNQTQVFTLTENVGFAKFDKTSAFKLVRAV